MKSTDEKLRDDIAKAIADVTGHGMREKCHAHAAAVLSILDSQPVREGVRDWHLRMAKVQRYTMQYRPDWAYNQALMMPCVDGEYVKFSDIEAYMAEKERRNG